MRRSFTHTLTRSHASQQTKERRATYKTETHTYTTVRRAFRHRPHRLDFKSTEELKEEELTLSMVADRVDNERPIGRQPFVRRPAQDEAHRTDFILFFFSFRLQRHAFQLTPRIPPVGLRSIYFENKKINV